MGKGTAEQGAAVAAGIEAGERARVALLDAVARLAGEVGKEAVGVKELEQPACAYAIVVGAGGPDAAVAETLQIVPVARRDAGGPGAE